MVRDASLPRPVLLALALVFAAVTIAYSVVWMYAARWEPDAQLGVFFEYSPPTHSFRITEVEVGTAAEQAGLSDGDIVLSYANKRVFSFDDLRRLSYEGQPGESVILEVRSADGTVSQLVMPRGPLGLTGGRGWSEAP